MGVSSNMAHPVTPLFIKSLGLGDSMFGYAFAAMSITNFLFSPTWAKLASKYGIIKINIICSFFYGISQLMFGISSTSFTLILARLSSGLFLGGILVTQLLYIIENSTMQQRGPDMVKNATLVIVSGTIGYLIGGTIGDYKIIYTFITQFVGLMVMVMFTLLFVADGHVKNNSQALKLKDINPFQSLKSKELVSNSFLKNIFLISIMASAATVLYDQTFNYYITDFFNFPPSVNGTVRAITGILAFLTNSTITLWIVRKTNLTKSLGTLFIGIAALILALINVNIPIIFIVINCIYFAFHAMYIPIIQNIVTDASVDQVSAVGTLNSLRSLGMIIGALLAGTTYTLMKKAPFMLAIIIYVAIGVYCIKVLSLYKNPRNIINDLKINYNEKQFNLAKEK